MSNETIRIRYTDGANKLEKISVGDWIDLACYEDVDMKTGEFQIIDLGVSMELPKGYEAIIAPRSSTFKRYGILQTNGVGVVDASFCGDLDKWGFPALATRDVHIDAGTRIAQFRIQKNQPEINFVEVESLENDNRGGFGSTN